MILALDPGARIGWAKSDWTCGTLDLQVVFNRDRGEAMSRLATWLEEQLQPPVHLLVVERPFGRSGLNTDLPSIIASRAHEVAWDFQVPRREFGVSTIRKAVLGSGRAPKTAVLPAMKAAGWPCRNDHEADACALLMATIEAAKAGENLAA